MYKAYQEFKSKLQPTPSDIEGPFYKENAPFNNELHDFPSLFLTGKVLDIDGKLLLDAILDVWQADENGVYDNVGFNLRGKVKVDGNGEYKLTTIIPGDYQINDNPPDFRCAHIHFKVSAKGYKLLTTQLYFPDDKYNATDHWFDPRRVIQHPNGVFDFVLEKV